MPTRRKQELFYKVMPDSLCTNRVAGALIKPCLLKEATEAQTAEFAEHCYSCFFCSAMVFNAQNMREASEYYGIRPGPDLDYFITEMQTFEIPNQLEEIVQEAAHIVYNFKK